MAVMENSWARSLMVKMSHCHCDVASSILAGPAKDKLLSTDKKIRIPSMLPKKVSLDSCGGVEGHAGNDRE